MLGGQVKVNKNGERSKITNLGRKRTNLDICR